MLPLLIYNGHLPVCKLSIIHFTSPTSERGRAQRKKHYEYTMYWLITCFFRPPSSFSLPRGVLCSACCFCGLRLGFDLAIAPFLYYLLSTAAGAFRALDMWCGPSSVLRACTFGGMVRCGMDLSGIAREGKGREGHGHHVIISQSACAGINRNVVISLARGFFASRTASCSLCDRRTTRTHRGPCLRAL